MGIGEGRNVGRFFRRRGESREGGLVKGMGEGVCCIVYRIGKVAQVLIDGVGVVDTFL